MRTGRGPYVRALSKPHHRLNRFASSLFYAAERGGFVVSFSEPPVCAFDLDSTVITGILTLTGTRIPGTDKRDASLQFAIFNSLDASSPPQLWGDKDISLQEQVEDIVSAISARARAFARKRMQSTKVELEARLADLLTSLRALDETPPGEMVGPLGESLAPVLAVDNERDTAP